MESPDNPRPLPRSSLLPLISQYFVSQAVGAAARLALADHLAAGPRTAEQLASATDAHAPSLHRLLRALASLGLVNERDDGAYELTPLGEPLRSDSPESVRAYALFILDEPVWRAWGDLTHTVRTGRMTFDASQAWDAERSENFDRAMTELTRLVARAVIAAFDFSPYRTIADIGGGNGTLVGAILAAHPALRGVVFDLKPGLRETPRYLESLGVADRCDIVEGSFFESVPADCDAYLLKSVLHDWPDDRALEILRVCRRSCKPAARLLIVEQVLPERVRDAASDRHKLLGDLNMMVLTGGRERTEADYRNLLGRAGFTLLDILATPSPFSLLLAGSDG